MSCNVILAFRQSKMWYKMYTTFVNLDIIFIPLDLIKLCFDTRTRLVSKHAFDEDLWDKYDIQIHSCNIHILYYTPNIGKEGYLLLDKNDIRHV